MTKPFEKAQLTLSHFDTIAFVPLEITQYDKKTFRKRSTLHCQTECFPTSRRKMYRRLARKCIEGMTKPFEKAQLTLSD